MITAIVAALALASPAALAPPARLAGAQAPDAFDVRDLPLVEVPATRPDGSVLAIMLSGDGGWAGIDKQIAKALSANGVAVVGFDSRAYLARTRTPDETARDVERVLRAYLARWGAARVALVGYSRGATLAPFIASRLAPDLRSRVALVALLAPEEHAGFKFHLTDLLRKTSRPSNPPVGPEIEKLRGLVIVCVYGADEVESACRGADSTLMRVVERPGGHHFDRDYQALAEILLGALAP